MNKPLVSVIIPFYNASQYIDETLQSIVAQSYSNIEVVICDDGSTDEQSMVLKGIVAGYANVVCFKTANGGQSAARNRAIDRAKGEYILALDADDLITPEYIAQGVVRFEADANVKIVYGVGQYFEGKTGLFSLGDFDMRRFAQSNHISAISMFRRNDWVVSGGYCEGLLFWEDWDFWLSILERGGVAYHLSDVCCLYRVRAEGMRKTATKERKIRALATLNERHADFFKKHLGGPLRRQRSLSRVINIFFR